MLIDLRRVAPGDLPNEVFEEFIAGNNYGPEMVEALRDHLVHGIDVKEAVKRNDVYANKFKMRLEKLQEEMARVGRITALLSPEQGRIDELFSLADNLAKAVDHLRSNHRSSTQDGLPGSSAER